MPASTSRTPARTFSGVSRLMRPSSSSSPQSPHVEPGGRCVHRFVTDRAPSPLVTRCSPGYPARDARSFSAAACTDRLVYPAENDAARLRRLRRWARARTDGPLSYAPAEAPARPRGVGGGLRDRAPRRRRRADLPALAHARLRGLDDLALPPDRWPHAGRRPRTDPRRHRLRLRRRRGRAPESLAVRPLLRRP